jgi:hypothetical protein
MKVIESTSTEYAASCKILSVLNYSNLRLSISLLKRLIYQTFPVLKLQVVEEVKPSLVHEKSNLRKRTLTYRMKTRNLLSKKVFLAKKHLRRMPRMNI